MPTSMSAIPATREPGGQKVRRSAMNRRSCGPAARNQSRRRRPVRQAGQQRRDHDSSSKVKPTSSIEGTSSRGASPHPKTPLVSNLGDRTMQPDAILLTPGPLTTPLAPSARCARLGLVGRLVQRRHRGTAPPITGDRPRREIRTSSCQCRAAAPSPWRLQSRRSCRRTASPRARQRRVLQAPGRTCRP